MAITTNRNQFGIDPNASSPNRIRRNFQKLAAIGGSSTINTIVAPLNLSNGALSLNINGSGGLTSNPGGLAVLCAPNGGLRDTAAGLLEYGYRSAASTPLAVDGDTYYDTVYGAPFWQENSVPVSAMGKLYNNIADSTVYNNSTGSVYAGVQYNIPSGFFVVGKGVEVLINGSVSCNVGDTFAVQFNFGVGNTIAQPVNYVVTGSNLNTARFFCSFILVCRSLGTLGVFGRTGFGLLETQNGVGGSSLQAPGGTSTTADTTGPINVNLSFTFSTARTANQTFIHQMVLKALN